MSTLEIPDVKIAFAGESLNDAVFLLHLLYAQMFMTRNYIHVALLL